MLKAVGTPLKFFGLVAILCLPVFSIAAANVRDKLSFYAFIYTLHTYLAVVGVFALICLFSPRSLYHPKELLEIHDPKLLPKQHPVAACVIALVALAFYMLFQAFVVYKTGDYSFGRIRKLRCRKKRPCLPFSISSCTSSERNNQGGGDDSSKWQRCGCT